MKFISIFKALRRPASQSLFDSGIPPPPRPRPPGIPVEDQGSLECGLGNCSGCGSSEAGHSSGNRSGLSQEVIYGLESQFINLQGSYLRAPDESMRAICPRRSLLAGELNAEASNGLEVAWGNLRRRKGVGIRGKVCFSPGRQWLNRSFTVGFSYISFLRWHRLGTSR